MLDQELLKRITANPEIFGGKPIVRGMRISVELILSLLAQGETADSILSDQGRGQVLQSHIVVMQGAQTSGDASITS